MKTTIGAAFATFMTLLFTWIACWIAVDVRHAWQVTTTIAAFIFGISAVMLIIAWVVENDSNDYGRY